MGLYQRCFAAVMASADAHQEALYGPRKQALFAGVHGTVLEIGPGSGVNLPYYPAGIRWIGVEPNPHMHSYIREKAKEQGLEIELREGSVTALAQDDASVDAVVSTLVLCSVPDLDAALAEIRRVLKPGGRFLFLEHVAAPRGTWLRRIQRGIRPIWKLVADGCHPDRETHHALEAAGFADVRYEQFDLDAPLPVVKPHIVGMATVA